MRGRRSTTLFFAFFISVFKLGTPGLRRQRRIFNIIIFLHEQRTRRRNSGVAGAVAAKGSCDFQHRRRYGQNHRQRERERRGREEEEKCKPFSIHEEFAWGVAMAASRLLPSFGSGSGDEVVKRLLWSQLCTSKSHSVTNRIETVGRHIFPLPRKGARLFREACGGDTTAELVKIGSVAVPYARAKDLWRVPQGYLKAKILRNLACSAIHNEAASRTRCFLSASLAHK